MSEIKLTPMGKPVRLGNRTVVFNTVEIIRSPEEIEAERFEAEERDKRIREAFDGLGGIIERMDKLLDKFKERLEE